jgi:hypothetical protein
MWIACSCYCVLKVCIDITLCDNDCQWLAAGAGPSCRQLTNAYSITSELGTCQHMLRHYTGVKCRLTNITVVHTYWGLGLVSLYRKKKINIWKLLVIYTKVMWIACSCYCVLKVCIDITLCDNDCQWLAAGWWLSLVSSTNKTDHHFITEILQHYIRVGYMSTYVAALHRC